MRTGGIGSWAAGWLHRYLRHLKHHAWHHLIVSFGVANLVVLFKWVFAPLDDQTQFIAHHVAYIKAASSREPTAFSGLAVVKIDKATFEGPKYLGASPLDRCELARDLGELLRHSGLQLLAVDFDLSPSGRLSAYWVGGADRHDQQGKAASMEINRVEQECQDRLDTLLRQEGNRERIVLMVPRLEELGPVARQHALCWQHHMVQSGVRFGSVDLYLSRGLVNKFHTQGPAAEPVPGKSGENGPAPVSAPAVRISYGAQGIAPIRCREVGMQSAQFQSRPDLPISELVYRSVLRDQVRMEAPQTQARILAGGNGVRTGPTAKSWTIPYQAAPQMFRRGEPLALNDPCLRSTPDLCGIRYIYLGAGYSADERYATPIGVLDGVDIHAVMSVCGPPTQTQARVSAALTHVAEFMLGALLFAPWLHFCWQRYFLARANAAGRPAPAIGPRAAYLWLVLMLGCVFLLTAVLVSLVPLLSFGCTLVAVPVALIVGLVIESGVAQKSVAEGHPSNDASHGKTTAHGTVDLVGGWLATLGYWAIALGAIFLLLDK